MPLNQWTFVAATWDTLMLRVFVGPAMFAFVVDGTAVTNPSTTMSVGYCIACGGTYGQFYGYIAEVSIDRLIVDRRCVVWQVSVVMGSAILPAFDCECFSGGDYMCCRSSIHRHKWAPLACRLADWLTCKAG